MYSTYWVQAGEEVHRRVGREEGEPLPALKLHKEVVRAVIVSVCHNSCSPNPQVNLNVNIIKNKNIIK